eukprot:scaffold654100_cov43-Prasinocladus_malaysianus.AAC.1
MPQSLGHVISACYYWRLSRTYTAVSSRCKPSNSCGADVSVKCILTENCGEKLPQGRTAILITYVFLSSTMVVTMFADARCWCRAGLEEAQGITYRGGVNPSTGLVGIMMMLGMCNKVTAFGFTLKASRAHAAGNSTEFQQDNCQNSCPLQINHYFQGRRDGVYRSDIDRNKHQLDVEGFFLK